MTDLHTLANAISDSSPNIKAFAIAVADKIEPAPTPPSTGGVWWAGPLPPASSWSVPAGLMTVATQADLKALCAAGGKGGSYKVAGFTYNGNLDIGNRNGLTLFFDPAWKLAGPSGSADAAVSVHGSGLVLHGGDITNPQGGNPTAGGGGDGIKIAPSGAPVTVTWTGVRVHDIANGAVSAQCNGQVVTGDLDVDVSGWGMRYKELDPHTYEKGTGIHGLYLGGSPSGKFTGRVVAYAHDSGVGAAWSCGSHMQDCEVWLSCRNLHRVTPDRFSGNGFQQWGGDNRNVTVKNLLVDTATLATFFESLSSGPVTIEHGRYRNILLLPPFQTSPHVTYQDFTKA